MLEFLSTDRENKMCFFIPGNSFFDYWTDFSTIDPMQEYFQHLKLNLRSTMIIKIIKHYILRSETIVGFLIHGDKQMRTNIGPDETLNI